MVHGVVAENMSLVYHSADKVFLGFDVSSREEEYRADFFFLQRVEGQGDHVLVILRPLLELQHLDHVARVGERHVAQCQPALVIDDLQHGVNIAVVEHKKAFGIADGVAVLLQNGDTEAVERVDIARVVVAGQGVDTLAHLVG